MELLLQIHKFFLDFWGYLEIYFWAAIRYCARSRRRVQLYRSRLHRMMNSWWAQRWDQRSSAIRPRSKWWFVHLCVCVERCTYTFAVHILLVLGVCTCIDVTYYIWNLCILCNFNDYIWCHCCDLSKGTRSHQGVHHDRFPQCFVPLLPRLRLARL